MILITDVQPKSAFEKQLAMTVASPSMARLAPLAQGSVAAKEFLDFSNVILHYSFSLLISRHRSS